MNRARLERLRQEYLFRLWSRDQETFMENAWHIRHPAYGRILFHLRDVQRDGLKHWATNRYSLTLKARQIGWSTLVAAHVFWSAFFKPDQTIIMLSRTEREAQDLLGKAKYGYSHLPRWLKERGPQLTRDHMQVMPFSNGSTVESMPSASDPARGKSASKVVVDEWAFLPNGEEAWASIEPVADIGGQVIGLSTANGIDNQFYTLWDEGQKGEGKFAPFFAPWSAVPERDQAWYEAQKKSLSATPWILAQEYPTTPEEAFIQSGRPFMDVDALNRYETVLPTVGHLRRAV